VLLNGADASAGFTVKRIHTTAKVHFEERDGGWSIHRIDLNAVASVSDIAAADFEEQMRSAKNQEELPGLAGRPVGVDIRLLAKLL
jgi:organic hydroperoxide reductase OsmC/OhrA